jgi:hypothetical protein
VKSNCLRILVVEYSKGTPDERKWSFQLFLSPIGLKSFLLSNKAITGRQAAFLADPVQSLVISRFALFP